MLAPNPIAPWMLDAQKRLSAAGLDLLHDFPWTRVRQVLPRTFSLPSFESPAPWGLFVGNSRKLWNRFVHTAALDEDDPLDRYVERVVTEAVALCPVRTWIGYSHTAAPLVLPMQRLAHASGFAHLGPAGLCVRPDVGPWCGLRAVIVFDSDVPSAAGTAAPALCQGCPAPCEEALSRALGGRYSSKAAEGCLSPRAEAFLAARDACPWGREQRYGQHQLRYHYDKDRLALVSDP